MPNMFQTIQYAVSDFFFFIHFNLRNTFCNFKSINFYLLGAIPNPNKKNM